LEFLLMPDVTTAPLIDGQGIPVELRDVEAELARLWGPAALELGGPAPEGTHVTRIALANLVLECLDGDVQALEPVVATVVERFPCRTIVLCRSADPARKVTAQISALCHLPSPGQPQVCSEQIVLRAGPNAIDLLPGAVRSLLEADLPHVLWWTGDPRKHPSLIQDLAQACSRVVLDLGDRCTDADALQLGLDTSHCSSSHDSVWFGLTRWRELVAQFFDGPGHGEKLESIESVVVEAVAPDPSRPTRLAIWLVAWLAGQLGWKPQGRPEHHPADDSSYALSACFRGARGDLSVRIMTRAMPPGCAAASQIAAVTIKTSARAGDARSEETDRLVRPWPGSPVVLIETETRELDRLPRGVDAPELDAAHRIAAALESSRIDIPFRKAVPIALWLLESSA
jgi:glucose-6-phosphate dehydrogenase assembly protein OpcA